MVREYKINCTIFLDVQSHPGLLYRNAINNIRSYLSLPFHHGAFLDDVEGAGHHGDDHVEHENRDEPHEEDEQDDGEPRHPTLVQLLPLAEKTKKK